MKKKILPLADVYKLLEPGPVVLVATAKKGIPNIMPMSWHTMLEFEPPLIGCVISNRNYSFNTVKSTKECTLNIPTVELAEKVVNCGTTSGSKIDKFEKFEFTAVKGSRVKAPLIAECYANLECKVVDTKLVNKYNMFILQVVKAWINPSMKNPRTIHHQGNGLFTVGGKTIKLPFKG